MNEFNQTVINNGDDYKTAKANSTAVSLAKVFGIMFIWLLVTAAVAFGLGALFTYSGFYKNTSGMLAVMISSAVVLVIMSIVTNLVLLKGNHSIAVPATLYAMVMGVLLSSFTIYIDWRLLGMAFGITALAFGIMTLIATLSKGNLSGLAVVAFGLIGGAAILALVSWIVILVSPAAFRPIYWVIEFAVFGFIMLITIYDIWRIKKIAEQGAMSSNINLYCAFTLYVDFINIFLRVLYFLLLIYQKK